MRPVHVLSLILLGVVSAEVGLPGVWPVKEQSKVAVRVPYYYMDASNTRKRIYTSAVLDDLLKRDLSDVIPGFTVRTYESFLDTVQSSETGVDWSVLLVGGYIRDLLRNVDSKDIDVGVYDYKLSIGPREERMFPRELLERFSSLFSSRYFEASEKSRKPNIWLSGSIVKAGQPEDGMPNYITPLEFMPASWTVSKSNYWRDFTVNSLYYEWKSKTIFDATGRGVQDLSQNVLRIACYDEPRESWNQYWSEGLPNGYRKIQRYFHMRMKGFVPDAQTRSFFVDMFKNVAAEKYTSAIQIMQYVQIGMERQTFAPTITGSKLKTKLRKLLEVCMEDGIIDRPDDFKWLMMKWWLRVVDSPQSPGNVRVEAVQNGLSDISVVVNTRDGPKKLSLPVSLVGTKDLVWDSIIYVESSEVSDVIIDSMSDARPQLPPASFMFSNALSCSEKVDVALFEVSKYDGLTAQMLRSYGERDTLRYLDKYRGYISKVSASFTHMNSIMRVKLLGPLKLWLANWKGKSHTLIPDGTINKLPGAVVCSARHSSGCEDVYRRGNIREMFNLMLRLADEYRDLSGNKDSCSSTYANPPSAYGWGFLGRVCSVEAGCKPVVSRTPFSRTSFDATCGEVVPPLSKAEKIWSGSCKSEESPIAWRTYADNQLPTYNRQPNPYAGYGYRNNDVEQDGFVLQAASNGFSSLTGPVSSFDRVFYIAKHQFYFTDDEMEMLRLAALCYAVPTEMGSMYDVLMVAEPYMPSKLTSMRPEDYLRLGEFLVDSDDYRRNLVDLPSEADFRGMLGIDPVPTEEAAAVPVRQADPAPGPDPFEVEKVPLDLRIQELVDQYLAKAKEMRQAEHFEKEQNGYDWEKRIEAPAPRIRGGRFEQWLKEQEEKDAAAARRKAFR